MYKNYVAFRFGAILDRFELNQNKAYEPRHGKSNKMSLRPTKTQISMGIRPVWSESSLCAQWVAKDPRCFHAVSEDSDQTGRMPRHPPSLIWVFAGRTATLLFLSCRGSYLKLIGITQKLTKFPNMITLMNWNSTLTDLLLSTCHTFWHFQSQDVLRLKWAASRQNRKMTCAPSEDADQTGLPPSLISLRCPHDERLVP